MKLEENKDIETLDIPEYIDQPEYVKNKTENYTYVYLICKIYNSIH